MIIYSHQAERFFQNILKNIPDKFERPDLLIKYLKNSIEANKNFLEIALKLPSKNISSQKESDIETGIRISQDFSFEKESYFFRMKMKDFYISVNGKESEKTSLLFGDQFYLLQTQNKNTSFFYWNIYNSVACISFLLDNSFSSTLKLKVKKILNFVATLSNLDQIKEKGKFALFFNKNDFWLGIEKKYFDESNKDLNVFISVPLFYKEKFLISIILKSNIEFDNPLLLLNIKNEKIQFCFKFDKKGFQTFSFFLKEDSMKKTLQNNRCLFIGNQLKEIKTHEVKYA